MKHDSCDPKDVALKSFFLGPQAENAPWVREEIDALFDHWFAWRRRLHPEDGEAVSDEERASPAFDGKRRRMAALLKELMKRLEAEVPKFSPRYVGHMVSETSLPALLGHIAILLHNPNNTSAEVSRVSGVIEDEAIAALASMIGYDPGLGKGHFTSGGTVANIESLWRARYRMDHWLSLGFALREAGAQLSLFDAAHLGWRTFYAELERLGLEEEDLRRHSFVAGNPLVQARRAEQLFGRRYDGPVVLVPSNKHFSWQKGISLLGLGGEAFRPVALDARGKLDVRDLERQIARAEDEGRPVLCVVSVLGTTEMGELDPVDRVQDLLERLRASDGLDLWHHVDAAYGGFFCSMLDGPTEKTFDAESLGALRAVRRADSVTIDPHKLGYVPYACGAILVRDAAHDLVSKFPAPYLSAHGTPGRWAKTLEGSRSASGATATWLTAKSVGFDSEGYGRIIERTVHTKRTLEESLLREIPGLRVAPGCDTNILCFVVAAHGEPFSKTNLRTAALHDRLPIDGGFTVSQTRLALDEYAELLADFSGRWDAVRDAPYLALVRVVLMNPFFSSKKTRTDFYADFTAGVQAVLAAL